FKKNIHALPVVDSQNKLLGIISEEALLEKIYPSYKDFFEDLELKDNAFLEERLKGMKFKRARDVMSKLVFTTSPEDSLFKTLSRMVMLHIRQLPVVDKKRRVIGMISKGDIFSYFYSSFVGT
ncbi:MAG: CBS domain-containing protein, partial [Patescibacteria group bacterium]